MGNQIAVLMLVHHDEELVRRVVKRLNHPLVDIFVHVDRKADFGSALDGMNCTVLPDSMRVDVRWGDVSMVQAMLRLLRYARDFENLGGCSDTSHYVFVSGQHYPIRPMESLVNYLAARPGKSFLDLMKKDDSLYQRFLPRATLYWPRWMIGRSTWQRIMGRVYLDLGMSGALPARGHEGLPFDDLSFGSQWVALSSEAAGWILDCIDESDGKVTRWFNNVRVPDECFFQTLLMASPYRGKVGDALAYVDWSAGQSSPKLLELEDYPALEAAATKGNCFFARKFESQKSAKVLDRIDQSLLSAGEC